MKKLGIFIDESGDFHLKSKHSPYYIYTMVFHNQKTSLKNLFISSDEFLAFSSLGKHAIHTMPLIRGEGYYRHVPKQDRMRLFNHIFNLTRKVPTKFKTFVYKKSQFSTGEQLKIKMALDLAFFISDISNDIKRFKNTTVYYDNGQTEIVELIDLVMRDKIRNLNVKVIDPLNYKLFQVADFICTMQLLKLKFENDKLNATEIRFFDSKKKLEKNYLKKLSIEMY